MAVNEAPEKIFYAPYGDIREDAPITDNDVEYIRKDAFIEKAYEYLSYHLDTSKIDVNYKFDFIEEFRKYMKGE